MRKSLDRRFTVATGAMVVHYEEMYRDVKGQFDSASDWSIDTFRHNATPTRALAPDRRDWMNLDPRSDLPTALAHNLGAIRVHRNAVAPALNGALSGRASDREVRRYHGFHL
jgi:hypothetical protein